ncbi:trypsin-like peptidase domain-containing protein [Streptomyces sp. 2A115]|uniref:trypsin-like peptidase domain-containing protein n=1 Tax=Streptomyces sp. 2A115 TaxID=3457439 RepID=UPI003FD00E26
MRGDRGLLPERVAQVIVALAGSGSGRRGSGYLVAPGKVLTAAHVVEGAADVRVRFQAERPGERIVEASVAWRHEGIDVAVLALLDDADPDIAPVSFGRVGETDAVLRCTALGFPRFKLRTDEDGSRYRDAEHVHATCAVLSNRREGTLDLGRATRLP